jgi:predicted enzyme related to lactoylglutathione lyase
MTSQVGLAEIGQIHVPVQDVERATAFYRDRLGMRFLFTASPGLAFFASGSVRLMLSRPEGPDQPQRSSVLYFRVSEIQQAYRTLVERGVRFHDAPHLIAKMTTYDLWMVFFYDSEDNMLALMEEAPHR